MRKNCSHCDIEQQLEEEKLAAGWLFVKCHICGETSTFSGEAWKKAHEIKFEKTTLAGPTIDLSIGLMETSNKEISAEKTHFAIPTAPLLRAEPARRKIKLEIPAPGPKKTSSNFSWSSSNVVAVVLALICVGSGFYILDSINKIKEGSSVAVVAETIEQKAPEKVAQPEQNAANTANSRVNRSPAIVDRIDLPTQAAPVPPEKDMEKSNVDSPAIVTVKAKLALLRSGPGQGYAALGNVSAPEKLILKGSKVVENQNWLEVQTSKGMMWIRADLVNQSDKGSTQ